VHGDSRFDDITTPDPDRKPVANRAGFRRDHGEDRRWLIPPEVWRNEVCAGINSREAAKTLAGLHMLEPDGEGKFSRSETVGGRNAFTCSSPQYSRVGTKRAKRLPNTWNTKDTSK
jgi:uncharacterized protein (DUF927 family)